MKAIRAEILRTGGPEVIEWCEGELTLPGPGQVTLVQSAVGINFIDTYHRSGIYPVELPGKLGLEAAGTIAAVGAGVTGFREGDRVATLGPERGAYASARNVAAGITVTGATTPKLRCLTLRPSSTSAPLLGDTQSFDTSTSSALRMSGRVPIARTFRFPTRTNSVKRPGRRVRGLVSRAAACIPEKAGVC